MKEDLENMNGELEIVQTTSFASGNTQIGVQNNYSGIAVEDATRIIMNLFLDNFPRLQQVAAETAKQRAEELCAETIQKLNDNGIHEFSAFKDPDVQYVFWEAQRDFARFGKQEMLDNLSSLMASRIKLDNEEYIKIVIDRALSVISFLSQGQLDYLSILFLLKRVVFHSIKTIDDLKSTLEQWSHVFSPSSASSVSLLNSLGCLEINLGDATERLAKTYGFPKDRIKEICPKDFADLTFDYGPSQIGMVLAIVNIENKTNYKFELATWIHQ